MSCDVAAVSGDGREKPGTGRRRSGWRRACPEAVQVRRCCGTRASLGNGLFARRSFEEGETLFEEEPICGSAVLLFDEQARSKARHCAHCTISLRRPDAAAEEVNVSCDRGCGAEYCSEACRTDAYWAHHELLCAARQPLWSEYEQHARECGNEYYVLAARMFALLRHEDALGSSAAGGGSGSGDSADDGWSSLPWADYAARPWWETMRRPRYDSDSDASSNAAEGGRAGSRSRALSAADAADVGGVAAVGAGTSSSGAAGSRCAAAGSSGAARAPDCGAPAAAAARSPSPAPSEATASSSGESGSASLDAFFQERVRDQTKETTELLRRVLRSDESSACCDASLPPQVDLALTVENFARVVGLIRMNSLAVESSDRSGTSDEVVRGMAVYAVTSAMNHSTVPNCYVAGDPSKPHHCAVVAKRAIAPDEELCIDYLEGSSFSVAQQCLILLQQYGISS
eukprot:TRINITY_DN31177_c0_g1_i1.p1 TRINITY_DN31177_c0_g1~~TRINITY_DN31177_c0_g1_i1.p1  ORF type:complete len:484 (-),score=113.97 TRINITY_DN31177_c0_g1_i1:116-1489(-)